MTDDGRHTPNREETILLKDDRVVDCSPMCSGQSVLSMSARATRQLDSAGLFCLLNQSSRVVTSAVVRFVLDGYLVDTTVGVGKAVGHVNPLETYSIHWHWPIHSLATFDCSHSALAVSFSVSTVYLPKNKRENKTTVFRVESQSRKTIIYDLVRLSLSFLLFRLTV